MNITVESCGKTKEIIWLPKNISITSNGVSFCIRANDKDFVFILKWSINFVLYIIFCYSRTQKQIHDTIKIIFTAAYTEIVYFTR